MDYGSANTRTIETITFFSGIVSQLTKFVPNLVTVFLNQKHFQTTCGMQLGQISTKMSSVGQRSFEESKQVDIFQTFRCESERSTLRSKPKEIRFSFPTKRKRYIVTSLLCIAFSDRI